MEAETFKQLLSLLRDSKPLTRGGRWASEPPVRSTYLVCCIMAVGVLQGATILYFELHITTGPLRLLFFISFLHFSIFIEDWRHEVQSSAS